MAPGLEIWRQYDGFPASPAQYILCRGWRLRRRDDPDPLGEEPAMAAAAGGKRCAAVHLRATRSYGSGAKGLHNGMLRNGRAGAAPGRTAGLDDKSKTRKMAVEREGG